MKANIYAVFLILLTSASMTAAAASYPAQYRGGYYGAPSQAKAGSPAAILEEGVNKLTAYIRKTRPQDRAVAMRYLKSEIVPYFDFAYMTQWAAGPAWRRMNPEQRASMQAELSQSFLTILANNLSTYSDQPIRFFTPRGQQRRGEITVSAWIMQPSGQPTKLEFRFYKSPKGGWKVFDVKAAGTSAVNYYRNQFRKKLRYRTQARGY